MLVLVLALVDGVVLVAGVVVTVVTVDVVVVTRDDCAGAAWVTWGTTIVDDTIAVEDEALVVGRLDDRLPTCMWKKKFLRPVKS